MRNKLYTLLLAGLCAFTGLDGQLRINEVNALNNSGLINPHTGEPDDWIEIYNGGSSDVDISHFHLSDRPQFPFAWTFPANTIVPAQGFLLVWADGSGDTLSAPRTNFKLDVRGETLVLYSDKRTFIDSLAFPRMYQDHSYGISGNELIFFSKPSPRSWNFSTYAYRVAAKVSFDPPAGVYNTRVIPNLSSGEGTIRYTLDGSEPGSGDPVFNGDLAIDQSTVIRARVFMDGSEPGDVCTASYIIHEGYQLPVISLATDPVGLWSDESGIYVIGENGIPGNCADDPRNWNQPWEKPMSMEYFNVEGQLGLQINAGMKIHGGCSRNAPMKSFGLIARNEYGSDLMKYPFFREKNIDEFKGLILRNSGNDFYDAFIRDGVIQAAVHPVMDIDHQAFEPVQVYLNGEYWGIHNLREKVNEHWISSNYGIDDENLDFLKNQWEIFAGTRDAWDELTLYMENNNLSYGAPYSVVESKVDINSYQDYLITQLFFANRDWPGNNQKWWRDAVNDGKWRFILFDLEFSMGLYEYRPSRNMFEFATLKGGTSWPNPNWSTLMIRKLLDNEGFREKFLAKYMMHLNTTFAPERIISIIDSLQMQIIDEYQVHIDRWGQQSFNGWLNDVEILRNFARQRPDHVWNNMRSFFSLGPIVNMHIAARGVDGTIVANGIEVPAAGMSGKYAAGSALDLFFRPGPGYKFKNWEINTGSVRDTFFLPKESNWKYNDNGVFPGSDWNTASYNDASWPYGQGILGYGDNNEATVLDFGPDEQNKTTSYYFRGEIEISDISRFSDFKIGLLRDDGAVIYINGAEVLRDNMPEGLIEMNTFASSFAGNEDESTYFSFPLSSSYFQTGTNTIAIEIHQNSLTSSDLKFDLELTASIVLEGGDMHFEENPLVLNPGTDITVRAVTEIDQRDLDLRINEIMASNMGAVLDDYGNDCDWIEVYNNGDEAVDMAGLYMTDNLLVPFKWRIPYGDPGETTIGAKGYLVFYADEAPLLGPRHLDFKLDNMGESVGLSYPSELTTIWVDSIHFSKQYINLSTGHFPDGTGNWIELDHTPGATNAQSTLSLMAKQILDISLFPNPANDILNIRISSQDGNMGNEVSLSLYDLTGRRIRTMIKPLWGSEFNEQMELSDLPAGIYLIVIGTNSGTHTMKFVKTDH